MWPGIESLQLVNPVSQIGKHPNIGHLGFRVIGYIHNFLHSHGSQESDKPFAESSMACLNSRVDHHDVRSRQHTPRLVERCVQSPARPMRDDIVLGGRKCRFAAVLGSHYFVGDELAHALGVVVVPSGEVPGGGVLVVFITWRNHGLDGGPLRSGLDGNRLHALWGASPRCGAPRVPVLILKSRRGCHILRCPLRGSSPCTRAACAWLWGLSAAVCEAASKVMCRPTRGNRARHGGPHRGASAGRWCFAGLGTWVSRRGVQRLTVHNAGVSFLSSLCVFLFLCFFLLFSLYLFALLECCSLLLALVCLVPGVVNLQVKHLLHRVILVPAGPLNLQLLGFALDAHALGLRVFPDLSDIRFRIHKSKPRVLGELAFHGLFQVAFAHHGLVGLGQASEPSRRGRVVGVAVRVVFERQTAVSSLEHHELMRKKFRRRLLVLGLCSDDELPANIPEQPTLGSELHLRVPPVQRQSALRVGQHGGPLPVLVGEIRDRQRGVGELLDLRLLHATLNDGVGVLAGNDAGLDECDSSLVATSGVEEELGIMKPFHMVAELPQHFLAVQIRHDRRHVLRVVHAQVGLELTVPGGQRLEGHHAAAPILERHGEHARPRVHVPDDVVRAGVRELHHLVD
mmetsp:Transcript_47054/g.124711  ORF Transcript_47054/g.124711 Transcript_47054/m.124711 type:complete len:627 (+) Transcript_47054:394-2274(+)